MLEDGILGEGITQDYFSSEFKDIFSNPKVKIIGHDLKTFVVYLKNRGIDSVNIDDTAIAAML